MTIWPARTNCSRVWAKVVVEENTLQAHIAALRKLIGHQAIATVTGRGYRFAGPVTRVDPAPAIRKHNLPHALTTFVGREKEIAEKHPLVLERYRRALDVGVTSAATLVAVRCDFPARALRGISLASCAARSRSR